MLGQHRTLQVLTTYSMAKVTVIGAPVSLFCARVEWALKLKGVEDYEYIEEDLKNKSTILLKHNPVHKKVPVLVHGDKAISESLLILEYIDETWKHNPLLPRDPHDRATARLLAKFCDEKCLFGAIGACEAVGEAKEKAMEAAQECFVLLEEEVSGRRFFGGDEVGFLDLVVGWVAYILDVMEEVGEMKVLDGVKFPSICRWAREFMEIPLIKECIPPREMVVEYISASLAYLRSKRP